MAANHLQLNHEKTEVLWCSSARRQYQIPTTPVRVGCTSVQHVTAARNLAIYLDGDVSMHTHVTTTVQACFAMLRQIRSVRHSLPRPALLTILQSLVINKLDSCSSVMAGASDVLLRRLQSVLNAAVWLVFSARKFDHTTPLLCELHSELSSGCVCWPTTASTALRLITLLRPSVQSLAMAHVITSDPLRCQPYWCSPRVVRLSETGHSRWLPTGMEWPTTTHSERAFSSCFPPRTEYLSVPVVVSWCDLTMNYALSTHPSLNAMSPCTGCYKPFLLILYGGTTTTTTTTTTCTVTFKSVKHQI